MERTRKDLAVEQSIVVDTKARKRQCGDEYYCGVFSVVRVENASTGYVVAQISSLASDKLRRSWQGW